MVQNIKTSNTSETKKSKKSNSKDNSNLYGSKTKKKKIIATQFKNYF